MQSPRNTASGTLIVKDIFPGSGEQYDYYSGYTYGPNSSAPQQLTNIEGVLFFTAEDDAHGQLDDTQEQHDRKYWHGKLHVIRPAIATTGTICTFGQRVGAH